MTDLKKRKLGKTDISLTELTLGTWGLCAESYGRIFAEQRARTLSRALELGILSFDMAPWWGEDGASEREVKAAVGTRRDEVVYITRAGALVADGNIARALEAADVRKSCEASLTRLGTDRLDVLLLHHPSETELRNDELRALLEALKTEGKVRAWGASVVQLDDARAALEAGAEVLCLPFHLLRQDLVRELSSDCSARGVGILARSVLLHGALAGRWSTKKRFLVEDHRTHRWTHEGLSERVQQVGDLRYLVHDNVLSMASAALRFVLAHELLSSAVIGPRTPGQAEASVESLSPEPYLPEADLARAKVR